MSIVPIIMCKYNKLMFIPLLENIKKLELPRNNIKLTRNLLYSNYLS